MYLCHTVFHCLKRPSLLKNYIWKSLHPREVCENDRWALPNYRTMKKMPPHVCSNPELNFKRNEPCTQICLYPSPLLPLLFSEDYPWRRKNFAITVRILGIRNSCWSANPRTMPANFCMNQVLRQKTHFLLRPKFVPSLLFCHITSAPVAEECSTYGIHWSRVAYMCPLSSPYLLEIVTVGISWLLAWTANSSNKTWLNEKQCIRKGTICMQFP